MKLAVFLFYLNLMLYTPDLQVALFKCTLGASESQRLSQSCCRTDGMFAKLLFTYLNQFYTQKHCVKSVLCFVENTVCSFACHVARGRQKTLQSDHKRLLRPHRNPENVFLRPECCLVRFTAPFSQASAMFIYRPSLIFNSWILEPVSNVRFMNQIPLKSRSVLFIFFLYVCVFSLILCLEGVLSCCVGVAGGSFSSGAQDRAEE